MTSKPEMIRKGFVLLSCVLCLNGCLPRDSRNTECVWHGEPEAGPLDTTQVRHRYHLSRDAEYAEELAIAYADRYHGLRTGNFVSGAVYERERDRCMFKMFQQIANEHGVPLRAVAESPGRNRMLIDAAFNLPYVLLYVLASIAVVRRILRSYPPQDGWTGAVVMLTLCSLLFAFLGVMTGEFWALNMEAMRNGSGHLSYRAGRVAWSRYAGDMFTFLWLVFWATAATRLRPRKRIAYSADPIA